jgi:hypothetical protein
MDYTQILNELREASLFDLYRLKVAINHQLDNPSRIQKIKMNLKLGQEITYFDEEENKLVEAKIISLHRTRLLVENKHDKKHWRIMYYSVDLGDEEKKIISLSNNNEVDRSKFAVGEHVGFYNRQNQKIYGEIIRLNPKTATIQVNGISRWRVSYPLLFKVIET